MIFLHYHDYPKYLLECTATEDKPRLSILEKSRSKKEKVVIPRVDGFKVQTSVLQCQEFVNKNDRIGSNPHIKKEQYNESHNGNNTISRK